MSVTLHISGTIHHISFMIEICKMIISPDVFFIVKIQIFQVDKGLEGQIMGQHDENVCRTLYFRNHVSFDMILICGTHVFIKGQDLQALFSFFFFLFFQNFDFWDYGEGQGQGVLIKGQKIAQYDKELCLSHSVSEEPYIRYCDFLYMGVK